MLTRDRAEALIGMYWEDVCDEIDNEIENTTKLLRTVTPDKLAILQERIRTLEMVKGIPPRIVEHNSPNEE